MKRFSKIRDYIALLKEQNEMINLYSKKSYDKLDFHVQDCVNIAESITNHECSVVDLGSGAGLPSIVIAIMNPLNKITAMESTQKKTRFLELVKASLQLDNLTIVNEDINAYLRSHPLKANYVTAKAFAPYEKVIKIAEKLALPYTQLIIPISKRQYEEYSQEQDRRFKLRDHALPGYYYLTQIY